MSDDLSFLKPETRERCSIRPFVAADEQLFVPIRPAVIPIMYCTQRIDFPLYLRIKNSLIEYLKPGEFNKQRLDEIWDVTLTTPPKATLLIRQNDREKFLERLDQIGSRVSKSIELEMVDRSNQPEGVPVAREIIYKRTGAIVTKERKPLIGKGNVIGKPLIDFTLKAHTGEDVTLSKACQTGPVMLVFYPGDFRPVCKSQLCNYSDFLPQFGDFGVQVFGLSGNSQSEHREFAEQYHIGFKLLTDIDHQFAKSYDCHSIFMLGALSRAVYIINDRGIILYRYVEPTILTRRRADELASVLTDLNQAGLLRMNRPENVKSNRVS